MVDDPRGARAFPEAFDEERICAGPTHENKVAEGCTVTPISSAWLQRYLADTEEPVVWQPTGSRMY